MTPTAKQARAALGIEVIKLGEPLSAEFSGIDFARPVGERARQDLFGEFFLTLQNPEKRHVGQF